MPVNEALLKGHRSYEDHTLGIREEFHRFSVGPGSVLGVLTAPLDAPRAHGWVVCQSYGMEQVDLQPLEAALARRIGAFGFPVLRFQCLGYGDSAAGDAPPSISTHVRDTIAATKYVRAITEVRDVSLLGTRFGGTVAALVADRIGAAKLAVVAPVTSGSRLMSDMLLSVILRDLVMRKADSAPTVHDLVDRLNSEGRLDVRGLLLTPQVFAENSRVDLLEDLHRYAGRSLLIQVSRGATQQAQLVKLAALFRELGGEVALRVVTDPWAPALGQPHYKGKEALHDVLRTLYDSVADAVLTWVDPAISEPQRGWGAG